MTWFRCLYCQLWTIEKMSLWKVFEKVTHSLLKSNCLPACGKQIRFQEVMWRNLASLLSIIEHCWLSLLNLNIFWQQEKGSLLCLYLLTLTRFTSKFYTYTPWKCQKTWLFVAFSRGIKRQRSCEMS